MTFAPRFAGVGIEPFVNNILAAIQAHQTDALAWAQGDQTLAPFKFFNNSVRLTTDWPVVWVAPRLEGLKVMDDGNLVGTAHRIEVGVEATYPATADGNDIGRRVMRYARAVKAMVQSMTHAELTVGLSESVSAVIDVEVSEIRYDDFFRAADSIYKKTAVMIVTIQLLEA